MFREGAGSNVPPLSERRFIASEGCVIAVTIAPPIGGGWKKFIGWTPHNAPLPCGACSDTALIDRDPRAAIGE